MALVECELLDQDLEWIKTQEFEYCTWVIFLLGIISNCGRGNWEPEELNTDAIASQG